jgi:H+-transporting ATPase
MSAVAMQSATRAHEAGSRAATDLEKLPLDKVLAQLVVKPEQGLSSAEARQRLAKYGPNALVEKEVSLLRKIVGHFTRPNAYMIEAAALVSAIIGHWDDFASSRRCCSSMPDLNSGRTARPPMRWLR